MYRYEKYPTSIEIYADQTKINLEDQLNRKNLSKTSDSCIGIINDENHKKIVSFNKQNIFK